MSGDNKKEEEYMDTLEITDVPVCDSEEEKCAQSSDVEKVEVLKAGSTEMNALRCKILALEIELGKREEELTLVAKLGQDLLVKDVSQQTTIDNLQMQLVMKQKRIEELDRALQVKDADEANNVSDDVTSAKALDKPYLLSDETNEKSIESVLEDIEHNLKRAEGGITKYWAFGDDDEGDESPKTAIVEKDLFARLCNILETCKKVASQIEFHPKSLSITMMKQEDSPRNSPYKSFASTFSTQTLELDLDLDIPDCREEDMDDVDESLDIGSQVDEDDTAGMEDICEAISRPLATSGVQNSASGFGDSWDMALKTALLVKYSDSSKYTPAYCVCDSQFLHVFKNEADAYKTLSTKSSMIPENFKKQKHAVEYYSIDLENSITRVIRRPLAQDADDEIPNARKSMVSWLKKRGSDALTDKYHNKRYFKLQVLENDLKPAGENDYNIDITLSADSQGSHSSTSSNTRRISRIRHSQGMSSSSDDGTASLTSSDVKSLDSSQPNGSKRSSSSHPIFLAFPSESERLMWADTFSKLGSEIQSTTGSLWIKQKGNVSSKKGDAGWMKRFAVLHQNKLELFDYNSSKLKETVQLEACNVEPAYSAHLFLSHRAHQNQLMTLRAYNAIERDWWLTELRRNFSLRDDFENEISAA